MIKAINVKKEFDNCLALNEINIEIRDGEFLAITGNSGSGKSTLLSILSGLDRPTSGKVLYDNDDINLFNDKELSFLRNKKIGFVFQNFFLMIVEKVNSA